MLSKTAALGCGNDILPGKGGLWVKEAAKSPGRVSPTCRHSGSAPATALEPLEQWLSSSGLLTMTEDAGEGHSGASGVIGDSLTVETMRMVMVLAVIAAKQVGTMCYYL